MALAHDSDVGGLYTATPATTDVDVTLSAWFQVTSDDGNPHFLFGIGRAATPLNGFSVAAQMNETDNPLRGYWAWEGNIDSVITSSGVTPGEWHHACVVFERQNVFITAGGNISNIGTAYIQNDGSCWTCGIATSGELGDNTTTDASSPVSVVGGHKFREISRSGSSNIALKTDGTAWTWGDNTNGELGNGTSGTQESSPVSVIGSHSFDTASTGKIGHGQNHVIALKADGSAWTWGLGANGRLGDDAATDRSSPVSVVGGHSFIQIDGGQTFCTALKVDGTVWSWGVNNGRLADGTIAARSSPVSAIGDHSFVAITSGQTTAHGLKTDGSAWSWGIGTLGRLGNNTTDTVSSPVSVVGNHSFIQIDVGQTTAIALKVDGSAWTWGSGATGALGDDTTDDKSSPVSVVGAHSFIRVNAGPQLAVAMKENGEIWCWGGSGNGKLGSGVAGNKSSPILVASMEVGHGVAYGNTVYIDGANAGSTRVTGVPDYLDQQIIGARSSGPIQDYLVGNIAECSIWNAALNVDEINALYKGFSPFSIRPSSLVGYWPMERESSSPRDITGKTGLLSFSSQPTTVPHPRKYPTG